MNLKTKVKTDERLLLAFFDDEETSQFALNVLVDSEMPLDHVSILGRASSSGDDPLGVYYPKAGDRMIGWGKLGAFWGGLWGLLSGAMGMFLIPGLAPLIAAGPIAHAFIGAAGGAGIGAGALAGAGAVSQLGTAIHRMGVPHYCIEEMEEWLRRGEILLMVILDQDEVNEWRKRLAIYRPLSLSDHPYVGISDVLLAATV